MSFGAPSSIISLALSFLCFFGTTFKDAAAKDRNRIPLKLFGNDVTQGHDGCRFALWQKNKDPKRSKFAYVLYAPISGGGMQPAWMKVGKKLHEMYRQDTSEAGPGFISPYQLFKSEDGSSRAIVEIKKQRAVKSGFKIDEAEIVVIQPKRHPFVISVRGEQGCPSIDEDAEDNAADEDAASADDRVHEKKSSAGQPDYRTIDGFPVTLTARKEYRKIKAIPVKIRRHIKKHLRSCDLRTSSKYSVRYAISRAMSLWYVPCALYARDFSVNFFVALNNNSQHVVPLYVNYPKKLKGKGFADGDLAELLNGSVDPKSGFIESYEEGVGGDCGSYSKFALRAVEGEAVEAFMVEYRRKKKCDGVIVNPSQMPIVYKAK